MLDAGASFFILVRFGVDLGLAEIVLDALALHAASPDQDFGMFNPLWAPRAAPIRADPRFAEWTESAGFVDLWRRTDWPDVCRGPSPEPFCSG